ncbi:MAG: tRNA (N6-threonylcarbamoyladenosine(37)-N6)-methyltransferase TrmO [Planctomycetes bacterium]|nr:tRNA (N6-threonylcarbamoyladenosine(37)-N6)-methyltransferase TrmO [Planctomycetota bacterium]
MKDELLGKLDRESRPAATWIEPAHEPVLRAEPIGFLRSGKRSKFSLPHQPVGDADERNVVELLPGRQFEQALLDLQGFDRIWLVWWFHRHGNWKPQVLPPRGRKQKRGVFATRSPHRPNPIGITPVRLVRVEKRRLVVGEVDLVDGTPILDIKPYVPALDAFPESKAGWVDELERAQDDAPRFQVSVSALAEAQAAFLEDGWALDVLDRAARRLAVDPSPHRTRRIRRHGSEFLIACGAWRVFFTVAGRLVEVLRMAPGYPHAYLVDPKLTRIADRHAQIAFSARWPDPPTARRRKGRSAKSPPGSSADPARATTSSMGSAARASAGRTPRPSTEKPR